MNRPLLCALTLFWIVLGCLPMPAKANFGDLLKTVNVPSSAQCAVIPELGRAIGTSVTVVPGTMLGLNQYPVLLLTSCFDLTGAQTGILYFLDPSTNPATLVKTINTSVTPDRGWGALALRGDKGDIVGCGNTASEAHPIYKIDISPYNSIPDGTATFLFNGTSGEDICDGLTWDTSDDTIFQSPDVSNTIYHYNSAGSLLGSFAAPAGCPNSGLAVGGGSLFASCNGILTIHQLNKTTGAVLTSFSSAGTRTEDIECDPVSFGAFNKAAMWSKDAYTNQLFAFEIPLGTCGPAGGASITPAQCPDGTTTDTDGDGLLDCWETNGIDFNRDGNIDLILYDVNGDGTIQASERADPNHKDIYLEADWMNLHQPDALAVANVVSSFAAAPVTNPDGLSGIRLHVQVDEEAVAHNNELAFEPCTGPATTGIPDFDVVKSTHFGTAAERASANSANVLDAKRFAFHYTLFAHNLLGKGGTSGCAELPGNDFVVSLGSWTTVGGHPRGNTNEQAGTLMHEFGHNFNLRHGGLDNINYKPNYLSVMSYTRQIDNQYVIARPLDYSRSALPTLTESALSEPVGIGGSPGDKTAFGPPPVRTDVNASGAIDWSRDGDTTDTGIAFDINNFGAGGNGSVLVGHNDWGNLLYKFQTSFDFADGVHLSTPQSDDMNIEEQALISPDSDNDGVVNIRDNCPWVSNTDQADSNNNGIGDACEPGGQTIQNLIGQVRAQLFNRGLETSLVAKLQAAAASVERANKVSAKNQLSAFIFEVRAQSGKTMSAQQATELISTAQDIIAHF